ncbi:uncharacterized protein [Apostichopus japonicus]
MVYGALHEVDEDTIDYDGRRRRKKERRKRRRERRRLAKPHPCAQRTYDVTLQEHELLCALRFHYGCKCLCTCNIPVQYEVRSGTCKSADGGDGTGSIENPLSDNSSSGEITPPCYHNNNSNVRRVFQSADPAKKACIFHNGNDDGDDNDDDVWVKRYSQKHQSINVQSRDAVDIENTCEEGLLHEKRDISPPRDTTDGNPNSFDRLSNWRTKFGRQKVSADDDINLITFSSIEESPLHAKRITSGNIRQASVDKEYEDIWHKRTSLDKMYEYSTL